MELELEWKDPGPLVFFKEINITIYETTYETYMKLKSSSINYTWLYLKLFSYISQNEILELDLT